MKINKPCVKCGGFDRYIDGRCKPCTIKSNKPSMLEFQKRKKIEHKPRKDLWPIIDGIKVCPRCGGNEKTTRGECVECRRKYMTEYRKTYALRCKLLMPPKMPKAPKPPKATPLFEIPRKGSPRSTLTKEQRAENRRKYSREWAKRKYQMDPQAGRDKSREWIANNPEKFKKMQYDKYWKDPGKYRSAAIEWAKRNPEKGKEKSRRAALDLSESYVASKLNIPTRLLRRHPDLLDAARDSIKSKRILRSLDEKEILSGVTKEQIAKKRKLQATREWRERNKDSHNAKQREARHANREEANRLQRERRNKNKQNAPKTK